MNVAVPVPIDEEPWPALVDTSDLPIEALSATDSGALGQSLRRVLSGLHDRDGVISAFSSAVSD